MSGSSYLYSQRVSLTERSRSSFALVVSCVQVRILLLSVMPMRAVSGKSKPMRGGLRTRTHRLVVADEGHSLLGRRECT
jgi:hypothetical protein